ncbi:MAG: hypothetical protein KAT43_02835 [Nanoarchaeota archaeon]|nr:hypothetical protein [Nanoarchaeota archaeon]
MAMPQKGTIHSTRRSGNYVRVSVKVPGRETMFYVEAPIRLGLKVGDKVEIMSAPRGSKAKQNIGYRIKKI